MSSLNPPDSPPANPVIPEGFATKLGKYGALLLAVVAAAQPFLDGEHNGDARFYAALATIIAVATIAGRMLQAAAQYLGIGGGEPEPPGLDLDDLPAHREPADQHTGLGD